VQNVPGSSGRRQWIADLTKRRLKVKMHQDQAGRLLCQTGWNHRKPERRVIARRETAMEECKLPSGSWQVNVPSPALPYTLL